MEKLKGLCAEAGRHVEQDGFTGEPVGFDRDYKRRLVSAIGDAFREEGARPFAVHKAAVQACRHTGGAAAVLAASYKGGQAVNSCKLIRACIQRWEACCELLPAA